MAVWRTNFGEYTTGQQPSGWSLPWGAQTYQVVADASAMGGKLLRQPDEGTSPFRILQWEDVGTLSDVGVLAKFRTSIVSSHIGVAVVRAASSLPSGYIVLITGFDGRLVVARLTGNISFSTIATFSVGVQANEWWWVKLWVEGTNLNAKAWKDGEEEPGGWQIQASNSNLSSGIVGVVSRNQLGDQDWDAVVFADNLAELIWEEPPPPTSVENLVHVQLRSFAPAENLVHTRFLKPVRRENLVHTFLRTHPPHINFVEGTRLRTIRQRDNLVHTLLRSRSWQRAEPPPSPWQPTAKGQPFWSRVNPPGTEWRKK